MQTLINLADPVDGFVPLGNFTVTIKDGITGDVLCTGTFGGFGNHIRPCSVCTVNSGAWNEPNPGCWPDEIPIGPCDDVLNYAPDPQFLGHTPLRYVKVILHFFQVEDPDNLGTNTPHPTDPQHYSSQDLDLIRSWFTHPDGVNEGLMANLCAPTAATSPHIPDSRIRFLLEHGEEGMDIFFHPNNEHWGISTHSCTKDDVTYPANFFSLRNEYVTSPGPPLSADYISWITEVEQQNAFHVFISRGHWTDLNDDDAPDDNIEQGNGLDCFNSTPGGYTLVVPQESYCVDSPTQYIMGNYDQYLDIKNGSSNASAEALGNQISGEFFHVMTVDHTSPFQHHFSHDISDDGCEDTDPSTDSNNWLGCDFDNRCHLSQCQLGRMLRFFEFSQPGFERFPTGYDANGDLVFSMTEQNCNLLDSDITVPDGADIVWAGPRSIRSNIIVESGGKLTITCDLGLPKGARITVQVNAELIVDGARLYNNCDGDFWDGIVVEGDHHAHQVKLGGTRPQGYVRLNPGSVVEGASTGVRLFDPSNPLHGSGGVIYARGATFLNNAVGVAFQPYQGHSPFTGQPIGYAGTFSDCRFIVDGDIGGGLASFSSMAVLQGVDGIRFSGCTFANDYPNGQAATADEKGIGIQTFNAGFSLTARCLGSTYPCQSYQRSAVRGLAMGIYAQNIGATASTFRVSRCDFDDNARGIVASSVHNVYAVLNNFKVGTDLPFAGPGTYAGIQLLRGTGFRIEENDLRPTTLAMPAGVEAVGIAIVTSGEEPNEIYNNTLDGLFTGNLANGKNRNETDPILNEGLQYLCNGHSLNSFDIAVPSEGYALGTIAANQGSSALAAGNSFTGTPVEPEGHILNELEPVEYFYSQGLEPVNTTPLLVSTTLVFDVNGCPTRLFGNKDGILSATEIQQVESDYYNATANAEKARSANILIQQALADTSGIDLPEARTWLANKGGLEARFMTVDTWLHEGDTTAARQSLDAIPNDFTLAGESLTEYQLFSQYKDIQISAVKNGQDDVQMLSANQAAITQIADAGDYYASVQAQGLVNSVQGIVYGPVLVLPDPVPPQQQLAAPGTETGSAPPAGIGGYLKAVPNPAKGRTVFSYRLPEGTVKGRITVTGIEGRTVRAFELTEADGKLEWDTGGVPEGIYLFSLVADGKAILTQRLSIIR